MDHLRRHPLVDCGDAAKASRVIPVLVIGTGMIDHGIMLPYVASLPI
ncbi:MAG: hypothetical protein R3D44_17045 [Hyphomicrobiaceae bacterium]